MKRLGMGRREQFDFIDQRFEPASEVNPQIVFTMKADHWPSAPALTF